MELEELKDKWLENDKKLDKNLKLNMNLLKNMNLKNSKTEFQALFNYEIISLITCIVLALYITILSISYLGAPLYSLSGFGSVVLVLIYAVFSFIRLSKFLKLEYFKSPVLLLQKQLINLKLTILKYRKIEIILMPLLIVGLCIIMVKSIHNIDVFQSTQFIIRMIIGVLIAIPVLVLFNKYYVDKKLASAKDFLKEIETFEE